MLLAAVLYGIGYGGTQTAAFLAMTERGTAADSGPVSALWNAGTDLGNEGIGRRQRIFQIALSDDPSAKRV